MQGQLKIFEENDTPPVRKTRRGGSQNPIVFHDYESFIAKFTENPKTTDECWTPQDVYEAVVRYVGMVVDLTGKQILRPFYPGGDYEHAEYPEDGIVIDNPPFSIFTKICKFYTANNIPFFLFGPGLTIGSVFKYCTARPKQQIFRFNPGKQQKIFPPKHPYLPKYPDCANCDYQKLAWRPNRQYCRICSSIKKCYKTEETENTKYLRKHTPEEKHQIYSKPFDEQFENVYSSNNHTVKRHILRDTNGMDYERVLDAAKLYSKSSNVEMLPEIHESETYIRKKIGLEGKSNPDLRTSKYGFVDVKSPFAYKKIEKNAIKASKQGAIACITDDHLLLQESKLEQLSKTILNNRDYTKDEVHWVVNGKLYKYNSLGKIQD